MSTATIGPVVVWTGTYFALTPIVNSTTIVPNTPAEKDLDGSRMKAKSGNSWVGASFTGAVAGALQTGVAAFFPYQPASAAQALSSKPFLVVFPELPWERNLHKDRSPLPDPVSRSPSSKISSIKKSSVTAADLVSRNSLRSKAISSTLLRSTLGSAALVTVYEGLKRTLKVENSSPPNKDVSSWAKYVATNWIAGGCAGLAYRAATVPLLPTSSPFGGNEIINLRATMKLGGYTFVYAGCVLAALTAIDVALQDSLQTQQQ